MKIKWDFSEFEEFANRLAEPYEFDTAMMTAVRNIAKVLHDHLLTNTPVVTGNLRKMWSAGGNLEFTVKPVPNGYEVILVNKAQNDKGFAYGLAVNDGHTMSGGQGWVMGRFFVENSVLQTAQSGQVEKIIMEQLQKWWDSV